MRVNRDCSVEVRAPKFVTKDDIAGFVENKADWIIKRQDDFKKLVNFHPVKEFRDGEKFPLSDKILILKIERVKKLKVFASEADGGTLNLFVSDKKTGRGFQEIASRALRDWYSEQAKIKASDIIDKYSRILNVRAGKLSIGNQKKRWGSCCVKGNIRLNWRLAMMPSSVMEYIVVHE
ncbi:MAG: M48 family metallopeptidase, partial [Elusimicrobiales bacterium]|nr:M48 family metallopeptidase [Elusimicrobiales bacterium]